MTGTRTRTTCPVKDLLPSKCEAWIDLTGDSDHKVCHHVHEIRVITDTDLFGYVERPSVFSQAPKIRFWASPRDARRPRTEGVSFPNNIPPQASRFAKNGNQCSPQAVQKAWPWLAWAGLGWPGYQAGGPLRPGRPGGRALMPNVV
jgi:hypothetical protein